MSDLNPTPIYDETAWDHGLAPMPPAPVVIFVVRETGHGIHHGTYPADVTR